MAIYQMSVSLGEYIDEIDLLVHTEVEEASPEVGIDSPTVTITGISISIDERKFYMPADTFTEICDHLKSSVNNYLKRIAEESVYVKNDGDQEEWIHKYLD